MINPTSVSSDIVGISLDGPTSPSIDVNLAPLAGETHGDGWGVGWYPGDRQSAMIAKDPAAKGNTVLMNATTDWSSFRSTVFLCKVRGAKVGYGFTETQPFLRSFAGRDWLFIHNGYLDLEKLNQLHGRKRRSMEPVGSTDSELAFCNLLTQLLEGDARTISGVDPSELHSWFCRLDELGSADMLISDGQSMVVFQGSQSSKPLGYARFLPPSGQELLKSASLQVALTDPRDSYRTSFLVASLMSGEVGWTPLQPRQMLIVRRASIVWDSHFSNQPSAFGSGSIGNPSTGQAQASVAQEPAGGNLAQEQVLNVRAQSQAPGGVQLAYRLFEVKHATHYQYGVPVEHSTHYFRLQPTDDPIQEVVKSSLLISSPAERIQYEDVFGNQAIHCTINTPYDRLTVEATSLVKIFATPPDDHNLSRRRSTLPLVWMPWQRQMMMPYLLPIELPEPQLIELTEYAMSFVSRNDSHLLRALEDLNLSIYRDYEYVPGSTSVVTTPFEIYTSRKGVCQDFANLFICLARLLSIPARYRMGYIYTGVNYANKIQSEASHAWAEVYLPYVGWRGFDPTNGCMVKQDHIRVACGRNYVDATPTSGTIYKGGGGELLNVDVKMKEMN